MGRILLVVAVAALALVALVGGSSVSTGTVVAVEARNGRCEKSSTPCTLFSAQVDYVAAGRPLRTVDRTWVRGHDAPITAAPFREGDTAWVAYAPETPTMAMVLSVRSVGTMALVVALPMLFGAAFVFGRARRG